VEVLAMTEAKIWVDDVPYPVIRRTVVDRTLTLRADCGTTKPFESGTYTLKVTGLEGGDRVAPPQFLEVPAAGTDDHYWLDLPIHFQGTQPVAALKATG
jgi:hypothetical protein